LIAENPFKERFRTWIKQSVCKYELMGLKINGMWIYEFLKLKQMECGDTSYLD